MSGSPIVFLPIDVLGCCLSAVVFRCCSLSGPFGRYYQGCSSLLYPLTLARNLGVWVDQTFRLARTSRVPPKIRKLPHAAMRAVPLLAQRMQGRWQVATAPLVSLLDFRAPAVLSSGDCRNYSVATPGAVLGGNATPTPGARTERRASALPANRETARGCASGPGSAVDSSGELPTLQQQIRQLMKLVHPDLWASSEHPEARSENERSFKLLQEYLAVAKVSPN